LTDRSLLGNRNGTRSQQLAATNR